LVTVADTRIDELRRRLERDPESRLFAQLAEELRKVGELEEAIAVARKGLDQHPNYPSARLTLGRALLDSGDPGAARAELETAVRGAPDNIIANRLLGEALEALGDVDGAIAQYRVTLEVAPGDRNVEARMEAVRQKAAGSVPAVGEEIGRPGPVAPPPPGSSEPRQEDRDEEQLPPTIRIRGSGEPPQPPRPPVPSRVTGAVPPVLSAGMAAEAGPPPAAGREQAERPVPPSRPTALPPPLPLPSPVPESTLPAAPREEGSPPETASEPFEGPDVPPEAEMLPDESDLPPAMPRAEPFPAEEELPPTLPPQSPPGGPATPFSSPTLAELYLQQGLLERAVEVYRQLVDEEPGNERARRRLAEVEALVGDADWPAPAAHAGGVADEREARRRALERTIELLEGLLAALRRR
jgi:tetratricopeptide (TPR) repeat protein